MTRFDIDVEGYWDVTVFLNVDTGRLNTGFTHSDTKKRRSVVVVSLCSSKEQLVNTLVHEYKHVQSVICRYYGVSEDSEDAAYLIGWLVQKSYASFIGFIK